MKKGEVWWADLPLPIGRRPVVLLSRDEAYNLRTKVTFVLVSTNIKSIPVEVILDKEDGLPKACAVNLDNIYTYNKNRLKQRICLLSHEKITRMNMALKFALAL